MILRIGDTFQDLIVTEVTDKFAFFGDKKLTWAAISKLIESGEKVYHDKSPIRKIDWTNKEDVLDFYNSFKTWDMGHNNRNSCILSDTPLVVKDNLVFYENQYYLPYPFDKYIKEERIYQEGFKSENITDGVYNIHLYNKKANDQQYKNKWFVAGIYVNLFVAKPMPTIITDIKQFKAIKEKIIAYKYDYYKSQDDISILYEFDPNNCEGEFTLKKFNPLLFFKVYYIPAGNNVRSGLTNEDIMSIMSPITDAIINIFKCALSSRLDFYVDIEDDYGMIYIYDPLYFRNNVGDEIWDLIDSEINK